MKRIQATLSDEVASALKAYAQLWGMSIQDVLSESVLFSMQKHYQMCPETKRIMDREEVPTDKRAQKRCYGQCCFSCRQETKCRTGIYEGEWEMRPEFLKYLKDPVTHREVPRSERQSPNPFHKEQSRSHIHHQKDLHS